MMLAPRAWNLHPKELEHIGKLSSISHFFCLAYFCRVSSVIEAGHPLHLSVFLPRFLAVWAAYFKFLIDNATFDFLVIHDFLSHCNVRYLPPECFELSKTPLISSKVSD